MLASKILSATDFSDHANKLVQCLGEFQSLGIRNVLFIKEGGSASELILLAAKEHDSTLIMMPTRGVDSMEGLKLGSTADIIARKSSLPLFFLPCDPIKNQNFLFSCKIKGE